MWSLGEHFRSDILSLNFLSQIKHSHVWRMAKAYFGFHFICIMCQMQRFKFVPQNIPNENEKSCAIPFTIIIIIISGSMVVVVIVVFVVVVVVIVNIITLSSYSYIQSNSNALLSKIIVVEFCLETKKKKRFENCAAIKYSIKYGAFHCRSQSQYQQNLWKCFCTFSLCSQKSNESFKKRTKFWLSQTEIYGCRKLEPRKWI